MINFNEAIQKIKVVGSKNVRAIPMEGQSINEGDYQIEIKANGAWVTIVAGVKKKMAEDIISQAVNKVILG